MKSSFTKLLGFHLTNQRASHLSKRIKTKKMKIVFVNTQLFPVVKFEKDRVLNVSFERLSKFQMRAFPLRFN